MGRSILSKAVVITRPEGMVIEINADQADPFPPPANGDWEMRLTPLRPGVGAAQSSGQRALAVGNGDQVDVVCHETVPENSGAVVCGVPRQKIQVEPAVVGGVENRLAIVSTLRNVVSDAGKNDTGAARHTSEVENTLHISHKNASVPFTPYNPSDGS